MNHTLPPQVCEKLMGELPKLVARFTVDVLTVAALAALQDAAGPSAEWRAVVEELAMSFPFGKDPDTMKLTDLVHRAQALVKPLPPIAKGGGW